MTTRERITARALELFNEQGIEYVGMRELAAELNIRVGNITYYFPTKDDLVFQLALDLAELNSRTIVVEENGTITSFLGMLEQAFRNHCRYRCLMISFVHLMKQNRLLSERYKRTEKTRNDTWRANLTNLASNGYITVAGPDDLAFLTSSIALIARFWLPEASVSYRHLSTEEQIRHYTGMIARILLPYATAKGKRQVRAFLA